MNHILNNNTSKEILIKGVALSGKTTALVNKIVYRAKLYNKNGLIVVRDFSMIEKVKNIIDLYSNSNNIVSILKSSIYVNDIKIYLATFKELYALHKFYGLGFFTIGIDDFDLFDKRFIPTILLKNVKLDYGKDYIPAQIIYSLNINEELKEFASKFKEVNTLNLVQNHDNLQILYKYVEYKDAEYKNELFTKEIK